MEIENVHDKGHVYNVMNKEVPSSSSLHHLVGIKSRSTAYREKNLYKKVSISLVVLSSILLIAFIIALSCYLSAAVNVKLCTSEECLRSAANLRLSMDLSVNPCEDFYKYTCGRWTNEHPNHGWYTHFSSFETADERIVISALNFLKSNESIHDPLPVRQTRELFLSCTNTVALDNLGYSGITKYLKEVALPTTPTFFNKTKAVNFTFDWIEVEVALKRTFAMDNFIGFIVDTDIYNRSRNVIYMGTPGAPCPLPSITKFKKTPLKNTNDGKNLEKDKEKEKLKSEAYKRMVKKIIKEIYVNTSKEEPDKDLLQKAANIIWNITEDLTVLADTNSSKMDIEFYQLKVNEIQKLSDQLHSKNNVSSKISWYRYITLMFKGISNVTLELHNTDHIYVPIHELSYLSEVAAYISSIPDLYLELYMWWITTYSMILSTTTDMTALVTKETESFTKSTVTRSRSLDCATIVINFMGIAVSYGIVDKTFLINTKPKVEHMLHDIKDAFVERVTQLSWMDQETKTATLEKSKEMISLIGFPEWLMNRTALESHYANIKMRNDTFLDNMMSMIKGIAIKQLEALREETERSWKTDPTTVNAYNYFSDNSITVPMAILTQPFYNLGLEVLNYGAIGSILGHELTHGFDNTGRKFDRFGNCKQWWSNRTIEAFEEKVQCFVNQYANLSLPSIEEKVDGERTLGENLADNGGLNHAFFAYKNFIKKKGKEPTLPGFENFSNMQLFFIAYGSIWCETIDKESLKLQLATDEHCPSSIRVMGTLQNSYEFSEAFKCARGSQMNPNRDRCRIW